MAPSDPVIQLQASRRHVLVGAAGLITVTSLPLLGCADGLEAHAPPASGQSPIASGPMARFVTSDGTEIAYKDWGSGPPVVFSHGWPLSADAWDSQMLFMAGNGFRVIAHDRRGHGRSSQTWQGNDMDHYADDLAQLLDHLDVQDAILVGHSTGGGEVVRYLGRHGSARVARTVLVGAVPPIMLQTEANPGGLPIATFDAIRTGVAADRSEFFRTLSGPFFGANRPGADPAAGLREAFWAMGMQGDMKAEYDCIRAFSETDFTQDLKAINVPTLIVHGDDDQIVPIADSAYLSAELVRDATLKVYPGAPHGLTMTQPDAFNGDLLAFAKA